MSNKLKTVHEGNAMNRDIIAMTMPLFVMSFFFYGPRVIALAVVGVVTAKLTDRFAALLRSRRYDKTENSSVPIALVIVLMMPATVRFRVVVAAVLVAVLVGKEAFGGYRSYPFNPSAVGYCVAAVSWPTEMMRYPAPNNWLFNQVASPGQLSWQQLYSLWTFEGQSLVEGPSYTLKMGGLPQVDDLSLLLGDYAGPLGVTSVLVILSCAVYLYIKKRLPLAAPLSFLITIAVIVFLFPRFNGVDWAANPWPWQQVLRRLEVLKFEMMSGALVFFAVFMVDEPGTLPRNTISRVVYGALLGFATVMFRYFGTYEMANCFAFLLVNAVSGYFDRAVAKGYAKRKGAART